MIPWIHRHLPILLAALLSLLVHALVLFPAIEVLLSGPRNGALDRASLGLANPGLRGVTRDSEADSKREKLDERTRQAQRKLNIRRIQQEERQKPPEKDPAEREPDQPQDDPIDDEKIELGAARLPEVEEPGGESGVQTRFEHLGRDPGLEDGAAERM
jgi:hypothetical protein